MGHMRNKNGNIYIALVCIGLNLAMFSISTVDWKLNIISYGVLVFLSIFGIVTVIFSLYKLTRNSKQLNNEFLDVHDY